MKNIKFITIMLVSLFLNASACSNTDDFEAEKMMSDIEKKLRLSSEMFEKMKPDLQKALEQKSKELKYSINEQVDKGFVDLDMMSKKLDAASVVAKSNLEKTLNGDQLKELKSFFASIDEEAIKKAREKLLNNLTMKLELTADQLEKLKPIFRDYLVQASELLRQASKQESDDFEKYREKSELLAKEMKGRLEEALDSKQMKELEKQLKEVRDRVKEKVFTAGK